MVTVALDLPCLTPAVAVEFLGSQVPVYKDDVLLSKGFSSHLADCSKESMLLVKAEPDKDTALKEEPTMHQGAQC